MNRIKKHSDKFAHEIYYISEVKVCGGLQLRLKTDRLEIIPYSREQLEQSLTDPAGAAREIGAKYGTVTPEMRDIQRSLYAMKLRSST